MRSGAALLAFAATVTPADALFRNFLACLFGNCPGESELQEQIDELKAQIDELKTDVENHANRPQPVLTFDEDTSLSVEEDTPGLLLRDVSGLRLLNASGSILFGRTDDCTIGTSGNGLELRDVQGVRVLNPGTGHPRVSFGPTDDRTIQAGPTGMIFEDPEGFHFNGKDMVFNGVPIFSSPSSIRFKENVRTMDDALEM